MEQDNHQDRTVPHARVPSGHERPESVPPLVEVDLGGLSHRGRVRLNNEDHFLVARLDRVMQILVTNLPADSVPDRHTETVYGMLVADGMGGQAAGEVASRTAISVLVELILRTPDLIMRLDGGVTDQALRRLTQRFQQIKDVLAERVEEDPSLKGMGTTMTLACSLGVDLLIAHVGDSRAYLFRQGQLKQLTRDQTMAQNLADTGAIRPEEVDTHPMRHVLVGALDSQGGKTDVDVRGLRLADGDQVLLCTDGLTNMVPDGTIAELLQRPGPAADACDALINLALDCGARDNVTVALGRYQITERPGKAVTKAWAS